MPWPRTSSRTPTMTPLTKNLHIVRDNPAGQYAAVALCGRRVNRLSLLDDAEGATCERCLAKAAVLATEAVPAPADAGEAADVPGDRVRELRERGYDDVRQGRGQQSVFLSEADRDAYADGVARAEGEREEAAGGPPSLVERLVRALEASVAFWTPDRCAAANVQDWKRRTEALLAEVRAAEPAARTLTGSAASSELTLTRVRFWSVTVERDGSVRHYATADAWGEEWTGMGATRGEALEDLVSTLS